MRLPGTSTSSSAEGSRGQALVEFAVVAPLLFLLILGTIEAGRFIFHYELVNNAAREGVRYAIVHGSASACPSGPPPPGETNPCDPTGANVKTAVREAALEIMSVGDLFIDEPVWTSRGNLTNPSPGDSSTGNNRRGEYVTVFVDFTYDPLFTQILNIAEMPTFNIKAESTLVVNN
jgi:hypothetical protein